MVETWRLSDPDYVDFTPETVQQAILKFRRLQNMGLSPWKYPEAMIECCKKLPEEEAGKFEAWIVNPAGEPDADAVDVRDFLKAQHALDVKHGRDAMDGGESSARTPCLQPLQEEEKSEITSIPSSEDEKECSN
jgi:hypothetical protein